MSLIDIGNHMIVAEAITGFSKVSELEFNLFSLTVNTLYYEYTVTSDDQSELLDLYDSIVKKLEEI